MVRIKVPYVDVFRDRHGRERIYFRRPKGKRTPLPGPLGSDAFHAAYKAALADEAPPAAPQKRVAKPRSMAALIESYYGSARYLDCKESTRMKYRGACDWLRERYADAPIPDMTRADAVRIQGRKAKDGPAAANTMLKVLRILIGHAIDLGWRATDPTLKMKKMREGEHRAWEDEEIARFEARWPLGSTERLGFALALYTGQRRSDVAAMTWADVDRARQTVRVVQEKTGTKLAVPLHRDLWAALAAHPRLSDIALLPTKAGRNYTTESFGNLMAEAIRAADLPRDCKLHGLRKSAGVRLAEVGCSTREIMAVLGHRSLSQAEHYTRHVNQARLARAAMDRLEGGRK